MPFFHEPLIGICPNSTGMVPWWSSTKIVQMVLIGCICRSWGQKEVFKMQLSIIVFSETTWPRAFMFGITSSRGPLPKLFKLCPWG